jgi:hypothetical protein
MTAIAPTVPTAGTPQTPEASAADKLAAAAYDQIAKLGRDHALILQGAGGVLTIVHPDTQRSEGVYCKCQWMSGKHGRLGPCACKDSGVKGQCVVAAVGAEAVPATDSGKQT